MTACPGLRQERLAARLYIEGSAVQPISSRRWRSVRLDRWSAPPRDPVIMHYDSAHLLVLLSVDLDSVDLHGILLRTRAKFVEVVALSLLSSEHRPNNRGERNSPRMGQWTSRLSS